MKFKMSTSSAIGSRYATIYYFVIYFLSSFLNQQVECSIAMKRLYEDLFTDYNRLILPVATNNSRVVVTVGLKLAQILDLNMMQQVLSTNVLVEQTWHDYKLQWQPELYDNIDMIHVPAENIWIPDIVLFNNADGNYELTIVAKARLYSNGTVVWKPPTMFKSTCEIDVEYFPFDVQSCYLRFASWTYAGDEVELRHVSSNKSKAEVGIDLSQFYKNVEWDVIDVPAYYNDLYYDCCTEPFPNITFKIVIRRKILFYFINLIFPVALMTFMTVSVFYLPPDSNEKVTLCISIITSLIVFFLIMLESIPASSLAVPLLSKYLLFTMLLVSLSACLSVYVLNIYHRSPSIHSMSPRVRKIFLESLPKLLKISRPDPQDRSSLNRFRKKKIAQQMLNQTTHKVYDVAQPLAASLNLMETLHKSYHIDPNVDDKLSRGNGDEDEGRYFRRYIDNYIDRLQKVKGANSAGEANTRASACKSRQELQKETEIITNVRCCEHNKCCSLANQPFNSAQPKNYFGEGNGNPSDWISSSSELKYPLMPGKKNESLPVGQMYSTWGARPQNVTCGCANVRATERANEDTLDMTFDYDCEMHDSKFNASIQRQSDLPSPPPPPRQLTHLSESLSIASRAGRLSSCAKELTRAGMLSSDESSSAEASDLVDKLISSINLINNVSDETDTTATASASIEHNEEFSKVNKSVFSNHNQGQTNQESHTCACRRRLYGVHHNLPSHLSQQPTPTPTPPPPLPSLNNQQERIRQEQDSFMKQPSDLLMSLRLSYDQMPAHVRAAIRSILFIADTIKNEDDENSAIEDWQSMSMVIDRLFLWIFLIICTFGSLIILAQAPALYDQRAPIDDELRIYIPPSNCSAARFSAVRGASILTNSTKNITLANNSTPTVKL